MNYQMRLDEETNKVNQLLCERAELTAELEPWRRMARQIKVLIGYYDVHNIDYYPERTNGANWVFSLLDPVSGIPTDGEGATLPDAVNAAYSKVVGDG